MSENLPVTPGVNLTRWFNDNGGVTKKNVREIMRLHPEWDWRNRSMFHRGSYVNGADAVDHDLTLEVHDDLSRSVAFIVFSNGANGLQAVVR